MRRPIELAYALAIGLAVGVGAGACGNGGGFPDAYKQPPAPDPGSFELQWSLTDASSSPLTCAQANATYVQVNVHNDESGDENSQQFNCTLAEAISGSLFPDTYDLTFQLFGTGSGSGSGSSVTLSSAAEQDGIQVLSDSTTVITAVVFVVST